MFGIFILPCFLLNTVFGWHDTIEDLAVFKKNSLTYISHIIMGVLLLKVFVNTNFNYGTVS